jgi:hypothetical protein
MAAGIPADDACCRRCRSVDAVARAADALARSCGLGQALQRLPAPDGDAVADDLARLLERLPAAR